MQDKNISSVIFISGRFRSGTSMLWNLFNQLPQYCAWYEPLHTNLLKHIAHVKPKKDHLGIDDYWQNYRSLNELSQFYKAEFGYDRLLLEKHEKHEKLAQYIEYIIAQSGDKIPVLQFNRMDLRLGWLRNKFPNATIININRNAFSSWVSSRKHLQHEADKNDESHPDAYDLMQWSVDLAQHFPMLLPKHNRNSYYRHYFIWKLSRLISDSNIDIHLSLEQDFLNTDNGISLLAKKLNWDKQAIEQVKKLIQKPQSHMQSTSLPNAFKDIETRINTTFKQTGLDKSYPSCPLLTLKLEHKDFWPNYPSNNHDSIKELLSALVFQKNELTELYKNQP